MKTKFLLPSSCILLTIAVSLLSSAIFIRGFESKSVNAQNSDVSSNFSLTSWNVVRNSLTDLLNGGWKVIAQSSHRVISATNGGQGPLAVDAITIVYTLTKGDKYITCAIENPKANKGGYSACRSLN